MTQPLVSVIIPNYNYALYLPQALDSVLAQSYPNIEIIVVDDGSTDNSKDILRSYGKRFRLIEQRNQGVSAARNRGVKEGHGGLVAFLDADDVWLPLKLERQVGRFLDDPELGLIHCGVEDINENGIALRSHLDGLEGRVAKEMLLFRRPVILGGGSGLVIPRATFESLEGYDLRLSTSADWDLCCRIAVRQRVGFVREVLMQYRVHGTNMHGNVNLMERDMLLAYSKAFDSPGLELQELRRQAYGNLHITLAGSFFRSGRYYDFARHALKSLWLTPDNFSRVLGFPVRWWNRHRRTEKHTETAKP